MHNKLFFLTKYYNMTIYKHNLFSTNKTQKHNIIWIIVFTLFTIMCFFLPVIDIC